MLECEHLLKIFFAEHGAKADALATLSFARSWAVERNQENLATGQAYLDGKGPFQRRAAQTMLVASFLTDFYAMVTRWADWASATVDEWPEDPTQAKADRPAMEEIVRRATW